MEPEFMSASGLRAEVEQGQQAADLTIGLREQLLKRAHELGRAIQHRVSQVTGPDTKYQGQGQPPLLPAQSRTASMPKDPDKTLLVVEDDVLCRELLTLALEEEGYAVEPACDGWDALQRIRHGRRPDCILLDLSMPQMDGRAFRAWQKQVPGLASVPVVVLSGQPHLAEEAALLGAEDYLQKPVSTEDLLAAVRRHC